MVRPLLLMLTAIALTGCSTLVAGQAIRPAALPDPPARPITRVLPDRTELSHALGSPMQPSYGGRPGGAQVLPNGMAKASPVRCIKVYAPAMRHTHQQAPVRAATRITWKTKRDHIQFPTTDLRPTFGVIELDTPDSARTWYRRLAADWRQYRHWPHLRCG
nr:sensor domain-containing protein [Mycobacteroides salmoniphilum]